MTEGKRVVPVRSIAFDDPGTAPAFLRTASVEFVEENGEQS